MLADNLRKSFVKELSNLLSYNVLSGICEVAKQAEHIMEFSFQRAIGSLEVCIKTYLRRLLNFANSMIMKQWKSRNMFKKYYYFQ